MTSKFEYKTNKAHVRDMVAAIALVEILVGTAQVAVVGKRPPKSTFARNHIRAPGNCVLIQPGDFSTGFTDNRIKTAQSETDPTYLERFTNALQVMEEDERNGANPIKLAQLVDFIIQQPSSRSRYMVGPLLQKIAVHLKKIIPSRWFEKIIMSTYKI